MNRVTVLKQIVKHKTIAANTTKVIIEDMVDVDEYCEELGLTGREAIMCLNCPENLAEKAVLVVDAYPHLWVRRHGHYFSYGVESCHGICAILTSNFAMNLWANS